MAMSCSNVNRKGFQLLIFTMRAYAYRNNANRSMSDDNLWVRFRMKVAFLVLMIALSK